MKSSSELESVGVVQEKELEQQLKEHRISEPDTKDVLKYSAWVSNTQSLLDELKIVRDMITAKTK